MDHAEHDGKYMIEAYLTHVLENNTMQNSTPDGETLPVCLSACVMNEW